MEARAVGLAGELVRRSRSKETARRGTFYVLPEDSYDDEKDHVRCRDCKGTGWYVGFTERRHCPTCDGSGYL